MGGGLLASEMRPRYLWHPGWHLRLLVELEALDSVSISAQTGIDKTSYFSRFLTRHFLTIFCTLLYTTRNTHGLLLSLCMTLEESGGIWRNQWRHLAAVSYQ